MSDDEPPKAATPDDLIQSTSELEKKPKIVSIKDFKKSEAANSNHEPQFEDMDFEEENIALHQICDQLHMALERERSRSKTLEKILNKMIKNQSQPPK